MAKSLVDELKTMGSIAYYPSSGTDLSDIDYFCSGGQTIEERKASKGKARDWSLKVPKPKAFVHSDVNFYMEFDSGKDFDLSEYGIHGSYSVVDFELLTHIDKPNRINGNFPYSGQVFKYSLKLWEQDEPVYLFFCLCENEFVASEIFLKNNIKVDYVWSKNWNGGKTYGTWLARASNLLGVKYFYTDWLCIPGLRGEPSNSIVYEKYPELCLEKYSSLKRTENHWIEEGAHGWVDEFTIEI